MKLNNASLAFLSFISLYFKIALYAVLKGLDLQLFGGGNDSNYYHSYAIGESTNAVNVWPIILRFLNVLGVYDRDIVSYCVFSLNIIFIPILVHYISVMRGPLSRQRNFLISYLIVSAYPTLFFFSLDLYRDLIMISVFLLAVLFLRISIEKRFAFFSILIFIALCYVAYLFRPYLGAAMVLSYMVFRIYSKTSRYPFGWILVYILGLLVCQSLGFFSSITAYRGIGGFEDGGATLGIGLYGRDPVTFVVFYFYSFFAQVFGLYFPNIPSSLVFVAESLPFIFIFYYVAKNKQFMNSLCHYLIVFFVVYTTVWVIGNDNLGTAVRLRMPGYLAIFICFLIISQRKKVQQRLSAANLGNNKRI